MHLFSKFLVVLLTLLVASGIEAQRLDDVLATSTPATFTAASLSPDGQRMYTDRRKHIAERRTELLNQMIAKAVLDLEARALNTSTEKLIAAQRAKVPEPTAQEIQKVYAANSATLGGRRLEEVREQIEEYIHHGAEEKLLAAYMQSLRAKYKVLPGKDVNSVGLAATDVVATIGSTTITASEYEKANRVALNDTEIEISEGILRDLEIAMLTVLAAEEAKSRNLDMGAFIAAEITDKLKLYTDEERAEVESALMKRLFAKYNAKILFRSSEPIVQNILVESDDPQIGPASAPVTVVMFTDLQCPACARTHPILKQVLSEYGSKVRFVVRDFPLEGIHANAVDAARAANAARAQGKFFEYAEILYRNQEALDRPSLIKYAAELGLNAKQFELDFNDAKAQSEVKKDQADARSYGVSSTPTIFVNGVKVQRFSAEGFRRAIDRALSK